MLEACPDMPLQQPTAASPSAQLTDVLVPDLTLEPLISANGKCLVLFITRAVSHIERTWLEDLRRLKLLKQQGHLPDLTQGCCAHMDAPHVDPADPAESVRQLGADASPETRERVAQALAADRLVAVDLWLALKLRRMTVSTFVLALAERHQRDAEEKPSPSVAALVRAEAAQRVAFASPSAPAATVSGDQGGDQGASVFNLTGANN